MKVLVACEFSGRVRDAFIRRGHDALSCDLLPTDAPDGPHYQGDVFDVIGDGWDLMVAHPPCTYLAASGLHWNKRIPGRAAKTEEALAFIRALMAAPIRRIAVENPVGAIGTRIRPADQYVQPWWFGDDASKKTGLWLTNLPPLVPTNRLPGDSRTRRANQTGSGQNRLGPSPDRWKLRSTTYQGIADAMADQWGGLES